MKTNFIKYAIGVIIGARVLQSLILSAAQYFTWKNNADIGQYFLPPHKTITYFLGYSWLHFFINTVFVIVSAFVFYFILKAIKKYRAEIFEEGELELGLVCALIVGWPNILLFVMLSFIMLLVISMARQTFLKEQFTTITIPLLVSLPIIFIFGSKIIQILHLEALIM